MGAFLLVKESGSQDTARARAVFRHKGFSEPAEFLLGDARLLLFQKQMNPVQNWFDSESGCRLFSAGTPVYKGLGYADGMRELLGDWESGNFDRSELVGCYCLLFFDGSRVSMAIDPSGLYHVFSSADGAVVSSSLQAVLVSDGASHPVNRDALLEQLLTGSIVGPDTLLEDIVLLTQEKQRRFRSPIADFQVARPSTTDDGLCPRSLSECVERQLTVLREYFERIRALSAETGTSMGVSGGYDSRLLLLLAREAGLGVFTYTYRSPGHDKEQDVAEKLTRHAGVLLTPIPVRTWEHLDGKELRANMEDALYYWDGRTNLTMGTFNDVHTRALRVKAMGPTRLGFNGLGGELYRNPEHLSAGSYDFGQWLQFFVMRPGCTAAVRDEKSAEALTDRLGQKYARLMGVDSLNRLDRQLARRWYRDVWLPYSAGPRLCAENQLSFALMPFADWSVTRESLKATPHIGVGGELEAEMIRTLDSRAAGIASYYGYSFEHMPLRTRLSDRVKSLVPLGPRLRAHVQRAMCSVRKRHPDSICRPPSSVQDGLRILRSINLPIDWNVLLSEDVNRSRCYYIAHFLDSFRKHLGFDSGGVTGS
ncbi:MAG: hypothetical protein JSU73_09940 [candidate division WOR-3 bacterium]|nr:MAG: hypothetical protein JSU73_09940 [candidate division WOR-3 bacterium]